jgi:hypothetical protein
MPTRSTIHAAFPVQIVCKSQRQAFEGFFDQQAIAAGGNDDFTPLRRLPATLRMSGFRQGRREACLFSRAAEAQQTEHSCNIQACLVSRATDDSARMETAISAGPSRNQQSDRGR